MALPLERNFHQRLQEVRIFAQLLQHLFEYGFWEDLNNAGLNGLYGKRAGDILLKAFQGCYPLMLEKELYRRIFSIVVKV